MYILNRIYMKCCPERQHGYKVQMRYTLWNFRWNWEELAAEQLLPEQMYASVDIGLAHYSRQANLWVFLNEWSVPRFSFVFLYILYCEYLFINLPTAGQTEIIKLVYGWINRFALAASKVTKLHRIYMHRALKPAHFKISLNYSLKVVGNEN
jgi:hypothetical protein